METIRAEMEPMALAALKSRVVAAKVRAVQRMAQALGQPDPFAQDEAGRRSALLSRAAPPVSCGDDAPLAPARGEVLAWAPMQMQPKGDGYALQHAGFRGRDAHRAADALDRIEGLTAAQRQAGRSYAALIERHDARGLRCVSVETMMQGRTGGAGHDFADRLLHEGDIIAGQRRRIGTASVLAPRRAAGKRLAISALALADMVCLEGRALDDVLRRHGWSCKGQHRAALRAALAAALDRVGTLIITP